MNKFELIDGTTMIYTPIYSPIFIAFKKTGAYYKQMKKKGYRCFFMKNIEDYNLLLQKIEESYNQKEELGRLNMLSAFGKITEEEETLRLEIQRENKYFS